MKTQRLLHISLLALTLLFSPSSHAALTNCAEFYHVKRPIAGSLVLHEYIGIYQGSLSVAGLPKAQADYLFFKRFIEGENLSEPGTMFQPDFIYLGKACGVHAKRAVRVAKKRSDYWKNKNQSWGTYLIRMGLTPVMGKPCRVAALDLAKHLDPILQ